MIDSIQIIDAISGLLVRAAPSCRAVYLDRVPAGFERPSFLIENIESEVREVNANTIERTERFVITAFGGVDSYGNTGARELMELQEQAARAFCAGYLRVADRALKLAAHKGARDMDKATIDVQLRYNESRPQDPQARPEPPLMAQVHTLIQEG